MALADIQYVVCLHHKMKFRGSIETGCIMDLTARWFSSSLPLYEPDWLCLVGQSKLWSDGERKRCSCPTINKFYHEQNLKIENMYLKVTYLVPFFHEKTPVLFTPISGSKG